jgi:hypothetical protein
MRFVSELTLKVYQSRYGTTNSHRSGRVSALRRFISVITSMLGMANHPLLSSSAVCCIP